MVDGYQTMQAASGLRIITKEPNPSDESYRRKTVCQKCLKKELRKERAEGVTGYTA